MGPGENQYAILDEDRASLSLYILPVPSSQEEIEKALDQKSFTENKVASNQGPLQFTLETEVDRIFSSPLGELLASSSNMDNHFCLKNYLWKMAK